MKATLITLLLILSAPALAEVSLQDCLEDSRLHGSSKTPVIPLPECATIIEGDSSSVSVLSEDKKWKASGNQRMIYVDSLGPDSLPVERNLLAGDQTELVSIKKIFIDSEQKKLMVIQVKGEKSELMIYKLNFLGNVSPLKVMRSEIFDTVTSVKFQGPDYLEVINSSGKYLVKADGESRSELSSKKAIQITPQ